MKTFKLNDITIHSFSVEELENTVISILATDVIPNIITTFNLDFFRITENNNEFLNICKNSLWNLPDGAGITKLIKLKYKIKINRITGHDVFPMLLEIANKQGYKVVIIGSSQDVLDKVSKKIHTTFRNIHENLLCLSPKYFFEKNEYLNREIVNQVRKFKPDITFAALGCPRQEIWLFNNMQDFGSKFNVGIGAVLDYYSGNKKRSPNLIQSFGLEWLWRLMNEPVRLFKRYLIFDLPFYVKTTFRIYKSRFFKNSN